MVASAVGGGGGASGIGSAVGAARCCGISGPWWGWRWRGRRSSWPSRRATGWATPGDGRDDDGADRGVHRRSGRVRGTGRSRPARTVTTVREPRDAVGQAPPGRVLRPVRAPLAGRRPVAAEPARLRAPLPDGASAGWRPCWMAPVLDGAWLDGGAPAAPGTLPGRSPVPSRTRRHLEEHRTGPRSAPAAVLPDRATGLPDGVRRSAGPDPDGSGARGNQPDGQGHGRGPAGRVRGRQRVCRVRGAAGADQLQPGARAVGAAGLRPPAAGPERRRPVRARPGVAPARPPRAGSTAGRRGARGRARTGRRGRPG